MIRRRRLAAELRRLREAAGLTCDEVAARLEFSASKISRIETGRVLVSPRDVRDLLETYGVPEDQRGRLIQLAHESRQKGWWQGFGYSVDPHLATYLGMEGTASEIRYYSATRIPALLQTEDYTRAIIRTIAPKMDPDIYKQRVEVRMRRQEVLEGDNRPRYRVLLDEAVLHRSIGDPAVMADQLDKVLEVERQGKVTIQVIPFDVGTYAAQESNFVLLEFGGKSLMSPVIFIEGLTGNQYIQRPSDIARYREAIEYLRDAALSPRDSVKFIREKRRELPGKA